MELAVLNIPGMISKEVKKEVDRVKKEVEEAVKNEALKLAKKKANEFVEEKRDAIKIALIILISVLVAAGITIMIVRLVKIGKAKKAVEEIDFENEEIELFVGDIDLDSEEEEPYEEAPEEEAPE